MESSSKGHSSKGNPIAILEEIKETGSGKKYPLFGNQALIGRNINADIPINSCSVSRNHAILEHTKLGGWYITDNGSINGVYVNEQKLEPANPFPLKHDSIISLGAPDLTNYKFKFQESSKFRKNRTQTPPKVVPSPCQLEDGLPGPSRRLENPQMGVTQQKAAKHSEASNAPRKSLRSATEALTTLQEHLQTFDSLLKMNDDIEKRVKQMLNHNEENLPADDSSPESTSLLTENRSFEEVHDSSANHATQELPKNSNDSQRTPQEKPKKKRSFSDAHDDLGEEIVAAERLVEEVAREKEIEIEKQKEKEKERIKRDRLLIQSMESELSCSICMEMFIEANTLACSHTFCAHCLETWKKSKKVCPICRTPITSFVPCLTINRLVEKIAEQHSPEERERRRVLIEDRNKPPAKKRKAAKRSPRATARRVRRFVPEPIQGQAADLMPEVISVDEIPWSDHLLPESVMDMILNDMVMSDLSGDEESPVEGYGYYGGYGRCYNCGRHGHWANGCPDV